MKQLCTKTAMLLAAAALAALLAGCAARPTIPIHGLDNAQHHVQAGNLALEQGRLWDALASFKRAQAMAPDYAPAYVGEGLTLARLNRFHRALKALGRALAKARGPRQKVAAHVARMRVYTWWRRPGWLGHVTKNFENALEEDPKSGAAYYFMGRAFVAAGHYRKAKAMFKKVVALNRAYTARATRQWRRIQDMERAGTGGFSGRLAARIPRLSRAQLAAMLVEELRLPRVHAFKAEGKSRLAWRPPRGVRLMGRPAGAALPPDVAGHPLALSIAEVLRLNLRGLRVFPNGRFYPNKPITRAEFALVLEDLLVRITGDDQLARRFVGSRSPFKDVPSGHYALNAIMLGTSRGFFRAGVGGRFRPGGTVSGAEALNVMKRFREFLKSRQVRLISD